MLDCVDQPSFLPLLQWLFQAHCDVTIPVNILRDTIDVTDLLSNPSFQELDPDLLDIFFDGKKVDANRFLLAKGGRLLRRVDVSALSSEELVKLIRDPAVDLNWLRTGIAQRIRSRRLPPRADPPVE
jgi:hypothetical protein